MHQYDMRSDFLFYIENQDDLVKLYNGRVIAIKNGKVLGEYDSEATAVSMLSSQHPLGSFLVQRCAPGPESYTVTYHSFNIIP